MANCRTFSRITRPGYETKHRWTQSAAVTLLIGSIGISLLGGCSQKSASDGRPQIGVLVFQEDQYFRLIEMGMRQVAQEQGVDLMLNNTFNTLDKEITLVDTYLANRVKAIAIAPLSAKGSIAALERAAQQKVPVVTFDSTIEADFPAAGIRSDQIDLGRQSGEAARRFIEQRLGGQAKIAMITTLAVSPELGAQRIQGFKEAVQVLPGVDFVVSQDAWLAPEASIVVENILTAHPEINIIWSANEGGTVGAFTAVVNKGLAGKVFVFGTDMSEQLGAALAAEDDVLQAVTGQRPYEIGQRALETALRASRGEPVEKSVTLPGILFSREKLEEAKQYVEFLRKVAADARDPAK